jgi:hypothetical protein
MTAAPTATPIAKEATPLSALSANNPQLATNMTPPAAALATSSKDLVNLPLK